MGFLDIFSSSEQRKPLIYGVRIPNSRGYLSRHTTKKNAIQKASKLKGGKVYRIYKSKNRRDVCVWLKTKYTTTATNRLRSKRRKKR